ncbi:unnamed protein product [Adineta ricciae]|uniref:RING-type domain-containing protein n=1 Tax=Adineta ricciae TaxID=249248 RepID=A0A816FGN1_ADIRI|nr:unnamed protein product [Adineta ricciae]CAF1661230.1 unnamed protein product [Adineta ricciae]
MSFADCAFDTNSNTDTTETLIKANSVDTDSKDTTTSGKWEYLDIGEVMNQILQDECGILTKTIDIIDNSPLKKIADHLNQSNVFIDNDPANRPTKGLIVIGSFGVGKSTILNWLIGDNSCFATGGNESAVTKKPERVVVRGQKFDFNIIDIPGFEPGRNNFEILRFMIRYILSKYFPINAILLVIPATETRFSKDLLEELSVYKETYTTPIIFVINKTPKDVDIMEDIEEQWNENLGRINEKVKIDGQVFVSMISRKRQSIPEQIGNELTATIIAHMVRDPDVVKSGRINIVDEDSKGLFLAACMKRASVAIAAGCAASAAVGASPIPFSDWILLVPIEIGMLLAIVRAFRLKLERKAVQYILFSSATSGLGGKFLGKFLATTVKMIPGLNIAAAIVDAGISSLITLSVGLAFMLALKNLYYEELKLDDLSTEEQQKLIQKYFYQYLKELQTRSKEQLYSLWERETSLSSSDREKLIDSTKKQTETAINNQQTQLQKKSIAIEKLKRNNIDVEEICCICLINPSNMVTDPCGHMCMCDADYEDHMARLSDSARVCPICRSQIKLAIKKFTPKT